MERDQRKRSRAADGGSGSGGDRKKERETKAEDPVAVEVEVVAPTEDEVDEFFAILRRMREAVKNFEKDKGVVAKWSDPSREGDHDREDCVEKRGGVVVLDLNTIPDDRE